MCRVRSGRVFVVGEEGMEWNTTIGVDSEGVCRGEEIMGWDTRIGVSSDCVSGEIRMCVGERNSNAAKLSYTAYAFP